MLLFNSSTQCSVIKRCSCSREARRSHILLQFHADTSCEWSGACAYPKCKESFHSVACCVCSPDCPSGTTDTGAICSRDIVLRPTSVAMACPVNTGNKAGLCYPDQKCPTAFPVDCGALCASNQEQCTKISIQLPANLLAIVGTVAVVAACTVASGGTLTPTCVASMIGAFGGGGNAVSFITTSVPKYC